MEVTQWWPHGEYYVIGGRAAIVADSTGFTALAVKAQPNAEPGFCCWSINSTFIICRLPHRVLRRIGEIERKRISRRPKTSGTKKARRRI